MEGPLADWEHSFLPVVRHWLARQNCYPFEYTDSPRDADIIVILEANSFKTEKYIATLLANPLLKEFSNKCFTINYEDAPSGFLPGLYTCLPRVKNNALRHRSWAYVFRTNADVTLRRRSWTSSPRLLFSFRGSPNSHPIRKRLFACKFKSPYAFSVTQVDKWFNHNEEERADYIDEILDSSFCLCPRGVGPGTIRLFEIMAAGRCPVILSDDWVPIPGIDWNSCAIRIPESALESIPEALTSRILDSPILGAAALRYWKKLFSPENMFGESLNQLMQIAGSRSAGYNEKDYQKLWQSRAFYKLNGWTLEQRVSRKLATLRSQWACFSSGLVSRH
ncbi:MAG TPA: exostosin family protein [Verrucomicrobiae bacterium]